MPEIATQLFSGIEPFVMSILPALAVVFIVSFAAGWWFAKSDGNFR